VNCWPKPIQKPNPPIYVPGGGSIETWDFCLDHDYNYSYLSFAGYKAGQALMDGYWDRVAERGDRDDSPGRAAFAQIFCVAETDAEAEALYAPHLLYFFNRCLHVYPGFSDPPGYRTIDTIKAGKLNQLRRENLELFKHLTWKDLVEGGFVIAGSPETVRERTEHMIRSLRVGTVFCLLHMGDMPDWKTRYSSQLFIDEVVPHVRGLWGDAYPDDDTRWWPTPLDGRVRPDRPGALADARRRVARAEVEDHLRELERNGRRAHLNVVAGGDAP
jgi:alkanesulfonate monooxygenase SsuD/methylene tetrahydromethanopterin reductase-like flavin-dependent oxidoreductase (luciferase family)